MIERYASEATHQYDLIQLDPTVDDHDDCFKGCLMVVDSVHAWGVKCHALVPRKRGEYPGIMPYRAAHGSYVKLGVAMWGIGETEPIQDQQDQDVDAPASCN